MFLLQRACTRCPTRADICAEMADGNLEYPLANIPPNDPKPKEGPEALGTALYVARIEAGSAKVGAMLSFVHFLSCSAIWGILSELQKC